METLQKMESLQKIMNMEKGRLYEKLQGKNPYFVNAYLEGFADGMLYANKLIEGYEDGRRRNGSASDTSEGKY